MNETDSAVEKPRLRLIAIKALGRKRVETCGIRRESFMSHRSAVVAVALLLLTVPAVANGPFKVDWNLRLRHEYVGDAAFSRDANADTLRLRASMLAARGPDWSLLVEGEGVAAAGYGMSWSRSHPLAAITWGWTTELARQTDYSGNPLHFMPT